MLENIKGYVKRQVFLETVVRVCISEGLRVEKKRDEKNELLFEITGGADLNYQLRQFGEEKHPEIGCCLGRFYSALYRVNSSIARVLDTSREWVGYESRDNDYGNSNNRTTLYIEDKLARKVFEELKPLVK